MNFMRWRGLYLGLSALLIIIGLISLARSGLKPAIDFTGGSLLELELEDPTQITQLSREQLQPNFEGVYHLSAVQQSGPKTILIRGSAIDNATKNGVVTKFRNDITPVKEVRFETVGPILGKELIIKTVVAALLVSLVITLYVARQFHDIKYGVSAILAMIHDSLILIGAFSLLGHFLGIEVDVLFVTALLTTLSFSVHDTIVVFDRIREFRRKHPKLPLQDIINAAVLQTLGRSLNNSITIIVMLSALVLLGGESIRWFAVALLIGAVTGTYSSTFIAAPLLLMWENLAQRRFSWPWK